AGKGEPARNGRPRCRTAPPPSRPDHRGRDWRPRPVAEGTDRPEEAIMTEKIDALQALPEETEGNDELNMASKSTASIVCCRRTRPGRVQGPRPPAPSS